MKGIVLTLILLCFLMIPSTVHAVQTAQDVIAQQAGISPDTLSNIPQTPEDAQNLLLKQAWEDIVSKNTYLGPIHRFFQTISPVFVVLFGEPYSLSPTLLAVIILWFWIVMDLAVILEGALPWNSWVSKIIAVACGIILAQIGYLHGFATFIGNLIYAQELWWVRLCIAIGMLVGMYVVYYIMRIIQSKLKTTKKAAKEKDLESKVDRQEAFVKGIKQGSGL